jgi:class 3 adenylate cyclase
VITGGIIFILIIFSIPFSIALASRLMRAGTRRGPQLAESSSSAELLERVRVLEKQLALRAKTESLSRQVSAEEAQELKSRLPLSQGTVTILFSDIEDFTRFVEHDDEIAREVVRTHNKMIRDQLKRFDGVEVKNWGDGFMVAFPSARKALLCAVGIQEAFRSYNDGRDDPIRVRIGINVGEPLTEGDDFIGRAVNLAARIADCGRGGEIWVSDIVRNLVGTMRGFQFIDRERRRLQGFSEPQQLYELVRIEALDSPERREMEENLSALEAKVKRDLTDD